MITMSVQPTLSPAGDTALDVLDTGATGNDIAAPGTASASRFAAAGSTGSHGAFIGRGEDRRTAAICATAKATLFRTIALWLAALMLALGCLAAQTAVASAGTAKIEISSSGSGIFKSTAIWWQRSPTETTHTLPVNLPKRGDLKITLPYLVQNRGDQPLYLFGLDTPTSDMLNIQNNKIDSAPDFTGGGYVKVEPWDTREVSFSFTPAAVGQTDFRAEITYALTENGTRQPFSFKVSGTTVLPPATPAKFHVSRSGSSYSHSGLGDLVADQLSDDMLDYDTVEEITYTIANIGDDPLTITAISFDRFDNIKDDIATHDVVTLPFTLGQYESKDIKISFAPGGEEDEAFFRIRFDHGDNDFTRFFIRGSVNNLPDAADAAYEITAVQFNGSSLTSQSDSNGDYYDLGTLSHSSAYEVLVSIKNTGTNDDLEIDGVSLDASASDPADIVASHSVVMDDDSTLPDPLSIAPGATETVKLLLSTKLDTTGSIVEQMSFSSNAVNAVGGAFPINLRAAVTPPAPKIDVSVNGDGTNIRGVTNFYNGVRIHQATTMELEPVTFTLSVANNGDLPLNISDIRHINGDLEDDDFGFQVAFSETSFTIAQNSAPAEITVTYTPGGNGWSDFGLVIYSDDPDNSSYMLVFSVSALALPEEDPDQEEVTLEFLTLDGGELPGSIDAYAPFPLRVRFSEDVFGFDPLTELGVKNARIELLEVSTQEYDFIVTPDGQGNVEIWVPAKSAFNSSGYGNSAAETIIPVNLPTGEDVPIMSVSISQAGNVNGDIIYNGVSGVVPAAGRVGVVASSFVMTIHNSGTKALSIINIEELLGEVDSFDVSSGSIIVPAKQSKEITISYKKLNIIRDPSNPIDHPIVQMKIRITSNNLNVIGEDKFDIHNPAIGKHQFDIHFNWPIISRSLNKSGSPTTLIKNAPDEVHSLQKFDVTVEFNEPVVGFSPSKLRVSNLVEDGPLRHRKQWIKEAGHQ